MRQFGFIKKAKAAKKAQGTRARRKNITEPKRTHEGLREISADAAANAPFS
jgi:hypothetical protein